MKQLDFPLATGAVANFLGVREDRLAYLSRARLIDRPRVVAGRRLWTPKNVRQAAEALGVLTPGRRNALARAQSEVASS